MSLDVDLLIDVDTGGAEPYVVELFSANVTHNLNEMAEAAGIYKHIWRPEELGIATAGELIGPLRKGLATLKSDPEKFSALDPSNGWGRYARFVPWVAEYLAACEKHPKARIRVDR